MRCFSARINELSQGKANLVLVLKIPSLSGSISKRSLKIGLENYSKEQTQAKLWVMIKSIAF
jgi:hypothetical protein